jgi:hypothetical protein
MPHVDSERPARETGAAPPGLPIVVFVITRLLAQQIG